MKKANQLKLAHFGGVRSTPIYSTVFWTEPHPAHV